MNHLRAATSTGATSQAPLTLVSRPDMLRSTVVGRTLKSRFSAPFSLISGRNQSVGKLLEVEQSKSTLDHSKQRFAVYSKQEQRHQQPMPNSSPSRNSCSPSTSHFPTTSYGHFNTAAPGGFTKDGRFKRAPKHRFPAPLRAASSGALPAPSEGDPNIITPISAFEGLLGIAGKAPRDADVSDSSADVSGLGGKEAVRRRARSVAGVDQGRLVEAWEVADPDSRFAEFQKVYIHYKIADPRSGGVASRGERDAEGRLVRSIDQLGVLESAPGAPSMAGRRSTNSESAPGAPSTPGKRSTDSESAGARGAASESLSGAPGERSGDSEGGEASTSGRPGFPTVLLHGFGASLFSWERVMQPVADLTGGPALAFDRPAFGLSARVEPKNLPVNPYSEKFSAAATLAFIDFLGAKKAVLLAHSAGSVVALSAYFQAPEKIAAIILVAPAVFPKTQKPSKPQTDPPDSAQRIPFWKLPFLWAKQAALAVASAAKWVVRQFRRGLGVLGLVLAAIVVRSRAAMWALRLILDRVGEAGVKSAWFDPEACTQDVLEAYKKPLKVRGWERGLLEFVLATMGGSPGSELPLGHRLGEVTCPVLVVTGNSDRLVPTWNSKKVAEALPQGQLRVIRKCGHLPQEETPGELRAAIGDFLRDHFGNSDK